MTRRRALSLSQLTSVSRLFGLLTTRAVATLLTYCLETNQNQGQWLINYLSTVSLVAERRGAERSSGLTLSARSSPAQHPIPRTGTWAEISGDDFLKGLLRLVWRCSAVGSTNSCRKTRTAKHAPPLTRGAELPDAGEPVHR